MREALYLAPLTAIVLVREPRIKAFYDRLTANGKPFKVAITACLRKIVVIPNARVREQIAENPAWNQKTA
ncbi:MAG: hypothetical protein ACREJ2_19165 [Planctomycetota bacterium]